MRFAIAAAALCCSTPALATGGFLCSPVKGEGPEMSLVIGHGAGLIGAALREDGRWRSTMEPKDRLLLGQGRIDRERTWVDIVHPETGESEALLRVRNKGFGGTGTLTRKGRSFAVRCRED